MGTGKKADRLFEQIAARKDVSVGEVKREMQIVIDATWNNPDPTARKKQLALFPNGKPSIEEFFRVIAKQIKR